MAKYKVLVTARSFGTADSKALDLLAANDCEVKKLVAADGPIPEQSMGIHYNEYHGPLDYILNPEDLAFVDGHVDLPKKPGLGVTVNKELVLEENQHPHSWKNPVWRHKDGSVAEW